MTEHRPLPSTAPPLGLVPPRLLGREALKAELNSTLAGAADGKITVLHGIAGGGKSSLGLWLAVQADDQGVDVHWVRGGDVMQSMLAIAVGYGMDATQLRRAQAGQLQARDAVWRYLGAAARRWLLVFDNVDDLRQDGLLGDSGDHYDGTGWIRADRAGTVLVTTRRGDPHPWGEAAVLHRVESLGNHDGAQLLRELAPAAGSEDEAAGLSGQLGGLPLALRLAGSYLGNPLARYRTFDAYGEAVRGDLELLDAGEPLAADPDDDAIARRSVRLTWELSLRLLDEHGMPAARTVLQVLSCCGAPHPLPIDLLSVGEPLKALGAPVADLTQTAVDRIVLALQAYALIDRLDPADHTLPTPCIVLHPLVAEVVAAATQASERRVAVWTTALALMEEYAPPFTDAENTPRWSVLPAIARYMLDRIADEPLDILAESVGFGAACTIHLVRTGALHDAHAMSALALRRAAPLAASHAAEHAEGHLGARFAAALANQVAGSNTAVAGEWRSLLADARRVESTDSGMLVVMRQLLAAALGGGGAAAEAEQAYRELLEDHARGVGVEHEMETRAGYGRLLDSVGRFAEAETELNAVLAARLEIHAADPEHQSVLTIRTALASVWVSQGRLIEARDALAAILRIEEDRYGVDNPLTLHTRMYLLSVSNLLQDSAETDAQLGQVLRIQRDALNPEHPMAVAGLATLMVRDAESLSQEPAVVEGQLIAAAETMANIVGEDNYLVHGIRLNAAAWGCMHDAVTGLAALESLLDTLVRRFGADGMLALTARMLRARVLLEIGDDYPAAETALRELLRDEIDAFGPDYPQTGTVRFLLANTLRLNGDYPGCEEQLLEAIATVGRLHGRDNERTWRLRRTLVQVRCAQRHYGEAEQEMLDLLGSINTVRPDSEDALQARVMLALLRADLGRVDETERDLRELLAFLHTLPVTGPESMYNIQVVRWLLAAAVRTIGGRHAEAEELYKTVEAGLLELLDPAGDLVVLRLELGELLHERGKYRQSERMLQLALATITEDDADELMARVLRALAVVTAELSAARALESQDPLPVHQSSPEPESTVAPESTPALGSKEAPESPAAPRESTWHAYLVGDSADPPFAHSDAAPEPELLPGRSALREVPVAPSSAPAPEIGPASTPRSAVVPDARFVAELAEIDAARTRADDHRARRRHSARFTNLLRRNGLSGPEAALLRRRYGLTLHDDGFPLAAFAQLSVASSIHVRLGAISSPEYLRCRVDTALISAETADQSFADGIDGLRARITDAFGAGHDLTLRVSRASAGILVAQGRSHEARVLLEAVVADVRASGTETACVLRDLAAIAESDRDPAAATDLYGRALSQLAAAPHHPLAPAIRAAHCAVGSDAAALPQLRAILREQLRVRGPAHPDTATTRVLLARCARSSRDYATARGELRIAVDILRLRLGPAHPATAAADAALAGLG